MDYGPGDRLIASAEYPEDGLTRCELLLAETDAENEKYPDAEAEAVAEKIDAMVKAGVTVKDGETCARPDTRISASCCAP
jgi:hypothetical protein